MIRNVMLCAALAAVTTTSTARADDGAPSPEAPLAPMREVQQPPQPQPSPLTAKYEKARFSGKRMFVEMLAGAAVGSLAGYLAFEAAGGDGVGALIAGLGANIAVTPLAVYGTGRAMGGMGTLGWTYTGGFLAFSGPAATPQEASLSLAIGMVLMPVTSSLMFEASSHMKSKAFERIASGLAIAPIVDRDRVTGARAGLAFRF